MQKFKKYFLFIFLGILYGNNMNLRPTFLVLNHFDRKLSTADAALKENFTNSIFEFDSTFYLLFDNIDEYENPASSYMNTIKDLGEKHKVNFVLFNQIKHVDDRFMLEGQMFNTRSGGLIYRRKIDLTNYLNGQINELNLWVGNVTGNIEKEWQKNRESILFKNPENIVQEKTPLGAAMRSLIFPGWGQAYSGKKVSPRVWAGTESALSLAVLFNFLKYEEATKNYLANLKLYNETDDEKEVERFRNQAESDWDEHKMFSELAIAFAGATGTGWVANSIHAWIVGPRSFKNLYQKWDPQLPDTTG
jgi:hypothetical protein